MIGGGHEKYNKFFAYITLFPIYMDLIFGNLPT